MNPKIIAIIPARGGSKRIPGKNIKDFAGKPMIAYPITAAKMSGVFDRIIVSTDSDRIASIACACGAEVPFLRPPELANDFVGTDEVFLHGIVEAEKMYGPVKYACCIYATTPLLRSEFLIEGLDLLRNSNAASAYSVTTFAAPIFRALQIDEHSRLKWLWPEYAATRSQDLPGTVHDAGQFYWVDTARFKERPDTLHDAVPLHLPRWLVQDIDTEDDWKICEMRYQLMSSRKAYV